MHLVAELAGATIGTLAFAFSPNANGFAGALFGWWLLALALLDGRFFLLPVALTIPLALIGIAAGVVGIPPLLLDRCVGVGAGYLAFSLIAYVYQKRTGRSGLGAGDAKLAGAIGAWLGWQSLPLVVLGSGILGLTWATWLHARGGKVDRHTRLPLGTLLAISAWGQWLYLTAVGAF